MPSAVHRTEGNTSHYLPVSLLYDDLMGDSGPILNLDSVRAKLTRSQENAQALKNEIRSWMDRHPYSILQKVNSDLTRYSVVIRINEPALFVRWSLVFAADALSNLRNALDHLIYAIACHEAARIPLPRKLGFDSQSQIAERTLTLKVAAGRLGKIVDPVRAAIEASQPYNRSHESVPPLLELLRDLNNTDKHRLLQLVYGTVHQGNIGFVGEKAVGNWTAVPFTGEVNDGSEIFAMVCDRPAPDMKFDRTIFDVVLAVRHRRRDPAGEDWTNRTEILALYNEMAAEVRRTIYEIAAKVR